MKQVNIFFHYLKWLYTISEKENTQDQNNTLMPMCGAVRVKALVMLLVMGVDFVSPLTVFALTSGPSQPEVQSFEPVGTTEMVDLFSGDFNYNIPLLDVNGYPINIAYHAGVSADQEASWVGLGWNINPGTINRNLRGLPDDMNGEDVLKELSMEDNTTVGLSGLLGLEIFGGAGNLSANVGFKYNTYKGLSQSFGAGISFTASQQESSTGMTAGLSFSYSDDGGLSLSPSLGISHSTALQNNQAIGNSLNVGATYNSRAGLKSINVGVSNSLKQTTYGGSNDKLKKERSSGGVNSGAMYSFGSTAYSPGVTMPFSSSNFSFTFKLGLDVFGAHGHVGVSGSYSNQKIDPQRQSTKKVGYGYLYEQRPGFSDKMEGRNHLLDFMRENEGAVADYTPFLPWATHTHDMYQVAAQGVGGMYRLMRNDVPALHDDYAHDKSTGGNGGVDFGGGQLLKGGINGGYNSTEYWSGAWLDANKLITKTGFVNKYVHSIEHPEYEPVYFKNVNEVTGQTQEYLDLVGGVKMLSPKRAGHGLYSSMNVKGGGQHAFNDIRKENVAKERALRNQLFSYRLASEAEFCLDKKIKSYGINADFSAEPTEINRNRYHKDHISEITILNNDGSRHVFGVPAYNNLQIERSFRTDPASSGDAAKGLVNYIEGTNDSKNNSAQIDNFYSGTETPAYVHSYLITGVLSPDYLDLSDNGITPDDLGSAVKFNYTRVNDNYKWRIPVDKAKYNPGLKSDKTDDAGSYVYGEKELWYVHSIEGKTHVALFKISEREDGLGVIGMNNNNRNYIKSGKSESERVYQLDSIQLFSKEDLYANGASAIPIKTVHFEYETELSSQLCQGISNHENNGGKLTLKKIYFTYGNSRKGQLNAYQFEYNNDEDYHLNSYDGWGTYSNPILPGSGDPLNSEFPYTTNDRSTADYYASQWNLSKILLPSGGEINIEYEADDYAYVEDKRAMSMCKLVGFGTEHGGTTIRANNLYNRKHQFDRVYFELNEQLNGTTEENKKVLRKEYLAEIGPNKQKWLQITVNADINGKGKYEYVKAYVEPETVTINGKKLIHCGVTDNGNTGWVQMKKVTLREDKGKLVNPIARSAWQYARLNLSHLVYPRSNAKKNEGDVTVSSISPLMGFLEEIKAMISGPNRVLMDKLYCSKIDPDRSWVRLCHPTKKRIGGGHRVKRIVLNDQWEEINYKDPNASNSTYGQEYDYTLPENSSTGTYSSISSGVASNIPMTMSDENPLTQPEFYDEENIMAMDNKYVFEHPLLKGHYPGPSVGYSRVKVSSISHEGQAQHHRQGFEVSEFYTAKEFPVKVYHSNVDGDFDKPWSTSLFNVGENKEQATAVQGYSIELNDMHGKAKSTASYNNSGDKISGVKYEYELQNGKLKNTILAIDKVGDIDDQELGVTVDFNVDYRYKKDYNFSSNIDGNADVMLFGVFPIPVPTIWPSINKSSTTVKTAVATKVIRRVGLLKKTTAFKEGSSISTENLLYDGQTGQILLTSVENEFGNKVYNFKYPAHWAYDEGMGQAFVNWGLELTNLKLTANGIETPASWTNSLEDYLYPGDECLFIGKGEFENTRALLHVFSGESGELQLIEPAGYNVNTANVFRGADFSLRILRSGRRNMAEVEIGSVTSLTNPLKYSGGSYSLEFDDVLATSAVEYKDKWTTDIGLFNTSECDTVYSDFYDYTMLVMNELIDSNVFYNEIWHDYSNGCNYNDTMTRFYFGFQQDTLFDWLLRTFLEDDNQTYFAEYSGFSVNKKLDVIYDTTTLLYDEFESLDAMQSEIDDQVNYYESIGYFYYTLYTRLHEKESPLKDSFSIRLVDTLQVAMNCYSGVSDSIYRYDNGEYQVISNNLAWNGSIELNLTDTFYVRKAHSEIYYPISDYDFYQFLLDKQDTEDNVTLLTRKSPLNIAVTPLVTQAYLDSLGTVDGSKEDTCGAGVLSILYRSFQGNTDYGISLSRCEEECDFHLNTKGYLVKNVLEILETDPIESNRLKVIAKVESHFNKIDTITMELSTDCGSFTTCAPKCNNAYYTNLMNPYRAAILGNWRPSRSWTYVGDREYNASAASPETDGAFSSFESFWEFNAGSYQPNFDNDNWVWSAEVTEYSPFGMELENMDPLGRYSGAVYGYSQTLPVAVGSNARHRQLWFEGFEEYGYYENYMGNLLCPQYEYAYEEGSDLANSGWLVPGGHTGNVHLQIHDDSLTQEVALNPEFITVDISVDKEAPEEVYTTTVEDVQVKFRPDSGTYVFSAWVSDGVILDAEDTMVNDALIRVEIVDDGAQVYSYVLMPTTMLIEGWQKVEAVINIPSNAQTLRIRYVALNGNTGLFDDFRIHPFYGNMKSYVYDHRTLRLMAELDENNFATIYEYDKEGNLVRIKKETERGVMSLQENRKHLRRNNQ